MIRINFTELNHKQFYGIYVCVSVDILEELLGLGFEAGA